MCGGGLASLAVHVKFTTTSAHTLLFERVMFAIKVTFSGLSTQKESIIRKKILGGSQHFAVSPSTHSNVFVVVVSLSLHYNLCSRVFM